MVYSLKNPCIARCKHSRILTKSGSFKDTRHFEIDLGGSGMEFEPGDSLAVMPTNVPELVDEVIQTLGLNGETIVDSPKGGSKTLRETLFADCSITETDKKLLAAIGEKVGPAASDLVALLAPERKADLDQHLYGREVIDFLLQFPQAKFEAQEFVNLLRKLQVRLYSIASSLKAHPNEVHLTVATVEYETFGRKRQGVCSTFLAHRLTPETSIPTFIKAGMGFRLPKPEEDTPIIMVGPGTGIAPFRAFVQERAATGAKGKAWLFFGEQQRAYDYFYEEEWLNYLAKGVLSKLDLAFSRDQGHKVYVQNRMKENAAEIWSWLEAGAIFYVCGDASRMAKDVDTALHQIVAEQGGRTTEQAAEYMEELKKAKRYRRDVY